MVVLRRFCFKRNFGGYFEWNACNYFQKIWSPTRYETYIRNNYISLVSFLRFCFRIITSKMLIFQGFLPLKKRLVATFSEARALSSRARYERSKFFRNSYTFSVALRHFCPSKNGLKNANFSSFFTSTKKFWRLLWLSPLISRKYLAEQGMDV